MTLTIHIWHLVVAAVVLLIWSGLYVGSRPPQNMVDVGNAMLGAALVGAGLILGVGFLVGSCVR